MHETNVCLEQILLLIQERLREGQSVRFTPRGISMRPMLEGGTGSSDPISAAPAAEEV